MNNYVVRTPNPDAYFDETPPYRSTVYAGSVEGDAVVSLLHESDPTKAGDTLIAAHVMPSNDYLYLDLTQWEAIRPLGNLPTQVERDEAGAPIGVIRAGVATGNLLYPHYAVPGQRLLSPTGNRFPDNNPPFFCEMRMLENVVYGWYPRWEISMESGAELSRDPSVRNVRVFSSEDCIFPDEYLYTTGAFIYGESLWHPGRMVWWTESNQFSVYAAPVHWAIYWGETENGRFSVPDAGVISNELFWEANQPDAEAEQFVLGVFQIAGVQAYGDVPLSPAQEKAIKDELLAAGVPSPQIAMCAAFPGAVTARELLIELLVCIFNGIITLP